MSLTFTAAALLSIFMSRLRKILATYRSSFLSKIDEKEVLPTIPHLSCQCRHAVLMSFLSD